MKAVFAALALLLGFNVDVAMAIDSARYTVVQFTNAPEALARVKEVKFVGHGTAKLVLIANACARRPGGDYRLMVTNAGDAKLKPGDFVITGFAPNKELRRSGVNWSVRKVRLKELPQYGGCPRANRHYSS